MVALQRVVTLLFVGALHKTKTAKAFIKNKCRLGWAGEATWHLHIKKLNELNVKNL